jgi:predicted Zn-dependent protease
MQERFYEIADQIVGQLKGDEVVMLTFDGEESDFVRFNHNAVRQAGSVSQSDLGIDLIRGQRHAEARLALTGNRQADEARAGALLAELRGRLDFLPEDPHLLYATEVQSTEKVGASELAPADAALGAILTRGQGYDSVGIYAQGPIYRGFANSLGQRNWFATHTFNLEWCFYLRADKAVKAEYAGFRWDDAALEERMRGAGEQLALLDREPKTIDPGKYRVYLAPKAVEEVVNILGWGGFGLKDHKAKISSLIRMTEGDDTLHRAVTMRENTAEGVSPNFDRMGFVKPDHVVLIKEGRFKEHMVSPRSAKEYGVPTNGADAYEFPYSFDMAAGEIPAEQVLRQLDTGLYINNLWYLNYSDRPACRMTGMTRFATFWVEKGELIAPLNVMRFDESIYRMFGSNLVGLTAERAMILANDTYGQREVASYRLPGALISDFELTL